MNRLKLNVLSNEVSRLTKAEFVKRSLNLNPIFAFVSLISILSFSVVRGEAAALPSVPSSNACTLCDDLDKIVRDYNSHSADETSDASIDLMFKVRDRIRDAKLSSDAELAVKEMKVLFQSAIAVMPDDFDLDCVANLLILKKSAGGAYMAAFKELHVSEQKKLKDAAKNFQSALRDGDRKAKAFDINDFRPKE